ncbi:MAG: hypothetical protein WCZ17_06590 [Candidatus Kapaibacterium sp.]
MLKRIAELVRHHVDFLTSTQLQTLNLQILGLYQEYDTFLLT